MWRSGCRQLPRRGAASRCASHSGATFPARVAVQTPPAAGRRVSTVLDSPSNSAVQFAFISIGVANRLARFNSTQPEAYGGYCLKRYPFTLAAPWRGQARPVPKTGWADTRASGRRRGSTWSPTRCTIIRFQSKRYARPDAYQGRSCTAAQDHTIVAKQGSYVYTDRGYDRTWFDLKSRDSVRMC